MKSILSICVLVLVLFVGSIAPAFAQGGNDKAGGRFRPDDSTPAASTGGGGETSDSAIESANATENSEAATEKEQEGVSRYLNAALAAVLSLFWWGVVIGLCVVAWGIALLLGSAFYKRGDPRSAYGAARLSFFSAFLLCFLLLTLSHFLGWLYYIPGWDWRLSGSLVVVFGLLSGFWLMVLMTQRNPA